MAWDKKVVDGVVYLREITLAYGRFWRFVQMPGLYGDGPPDKTKQSDHGQPHVICECGCQQFTLRYGSCEVYARCSRCGLEESVGNG